MVTTRSQSQQMRTRSKRWRKEETADPNPKPTKRRRMSSRLKKQREMKAASASRSSSSNKSERSKSTQETKDTQAAVVKRIAHTVQPTSTHSSRNIYHHMIEQELGHSSLLRRHQLPSTKHREHHLQDFVRDRYVDRIFDHENEFEITKSKSILQRDRAVEFALHREAPGAFLGGKTGEIHIWNFDNNTSQTLAMHEGRVTGIRFDPCGGNVNQFWTSSHDGTVRLTDMCRLTDVLGNTLYGTDVLSSDSVLHNFDVVNHTVFAVDNDGVLSVRDCRHTKTERYKLSTKKLASVACSPTQHEVIATAANKGNLVQIWDCRKLASRTPLYTNTYPNVQNYVTFSNDGTKLLSLGRDDCVHVYHDVSAQGFRMGASVAHSNNVGIWVSMFRPAFHPHSSQLITTGDVERKAIDLICIDKESTNMVCRHITDPLLTSISSFGEFHATLDVLVSVSYGKAFLWTRMQS